ncbi:hypothetical protein [Hymenobacter mucosus]|uniref:Uncharacterized protein n=1 Tax=Hymenobacter mucosus TaxID=1411120 RepID=A0A239AAT5_9BACT|nr:hypothetical protein [Hymenobacter mucosus]SNR92134.1 hypothetical protein SAMN06269173_11178 [Hymenobacter mucosus]
METAIKERPILFSGAMVRALLAGTKTQTRRTTGLDFINENPSCWQRQWVPAKDGKHWLFTCGDDRVQVRCPYGVEGDRLWVKETHQMGFSTHVSDCGYLYRATDVDKRTHHGVYCYEKDGKYYDHYDKQFVWRPSIFMKRVASRILLELVSVRVERLQDISEADAVAEGVEEHIIPALGPGTWGMWKNYLWSEKTVDKQAKAKCSAKEAYETLWESINGPGSWQANPWVWVISFQVVK